MRLCSERTPTVMHEELINPRAAECASPAITWSTALSIYLHAVNDNTIMPTVVIRNFFFIIKFSAVTPHRLIAAEVPFELSLAIPNATITLSEVTLSVISDPLKAQKPQSTLISRPQHKRLHHFIKVTFQGYGKHRYWSPRGYKFLRDRRIPV